MGEGRHQGNKLGITRSKYIRYAVIRALIQDGYPLDKITDKFQKFYAKENQLRKILSDFWIVCRAKGDL